MYADRVKGHFKNAPAARLGHGLRPFPYAFAYIMVMILQTVCEAKRSVLKNKGKRPFCLPVNLDKSEKKRYNA